MSPDFHYAEGVPNSIFSDKNYSESEKLEIKLR